MKKPRAGLPPPSDQNIDAILVAQFLHDESDGSEEISRVAQEHIPTGAKEATVDRAFEPMRWGISRGLSILEKLETIPRLGMKILIFSPKLIILTLSILEQ